MILQESLREIVRTQAPMPPGIEREQLAAVNLAAPHALILSGVRRSGKSTLLSQLMKRTGASYYVNFDDPRLHGFSVSDFGRLQAALAEVFGERKHYFFDEIQNVPKWELLVRHLLDSRKRCIITGSNASLLSRELGTRLTGRHLTYELFPFSYSEFLLLLKKKESAESFGEYLSLGGFPEYLTTTDRAVLQELFKDILTRDIAVRHGIRDERALQELAQYLLTNAGKEYTLNKLTKTFGMKSVTTASAYVSYLQDSYLLFSVPRFSYSLKRQMINPKKAYCIDTALARANTISFTEDRGRMLENAVFLHLRRRYKDLYYFKEKGECDFIVRTAGKALQAIQVCHELTEENVKRETDGLREAMKTLRITDGFVVTLGQEDNLDGIPVVPAWRWFSERP